MATTFKEAEMGIRRAGGYAQGTQELNTFSALLILFICRICGRKRLFSRRPKRWI